VVVELEIKIVMLSEISQTQNAESRFFLKKGMNVEGGLFGKKRDQWTRDRGGQENMIKVY
jgi:hypothetical protein